MIEVRGIDTIEFVKPGRLGSPIANHGSTRGGHHGSRMWRNGQTQPRRRREASVALHAAASRTVSASCSVRARSRAGTALASPPVAEDDRRVSRARPMRPRPTGLPSRRRTPSSSSPRSASISVVDFSEVRLEAVADSRPGAGPATHERRQRLHRRSQARCSPTPERSARRSARDARSSGTRRTAVIEHERRVEGSRRARVETSCARAASLGTGASGSTASVVTTSPRSTKDPTPGTIRSLLPPGQPRPARAAHARSSTGSWSQSGRARTSSPSG